MKFATKLYIEQKWVHKKCSGIKGSMLKVVKSFICRGCVNPATSAGRTSVDIGASAKLELVDKFCYHHHHHHHHHRHF